MFKITKTYIKNLLIIDGKQHIDNRGYLRELTSEKEMGSKFKFVYYSKSKKNVLRGLHFQFVNPQGKYLSVIKGKIFDVMVDLRSKSKTFGKTFSIILSDKNCMSVYIPEGFAHGFLSLEKENIISYNCTNYRNIKSEVTIKWDDKKLNIKWPSKKILLSKKDEKAITFDDYNETYKL